MTPADFKVVASMRARAALAGYQLVSMGDGSFVVSRWGMVSMLANAAAVEAFLRRVGQGSP